MSPTVHWIGLFDWNLLMPVVGYNQLNELKFTEIRFNTHIQKPPHTRLQKKPQIFKDTHISRYFWFVRVCVSVFYLRPQFPLNSYINVIFFLLFMDDYSLIWVFCCPNRRRGRGGIHAKENQKAPNNTRTSIRVVLPSAFGRVVLSSVFDSYCHFIFDWLSTVIDKSVHTI